MKISDWKETKETSQMAVDVPGAESGRLFIQTQNYFNFERLFYEMEQINASLMFYTSVSFAIKSSLRCR